MEISFENNFAEWAKELREAQREQVPYATFLALNRTAEEMKAEHTRLLPLIFDRPTRYTMNSLRVDYAKRNVKLRAAVYFKDDESQKYGKHYLMSQVKGGTRPHKRLEFLLIQRGIMAPDEFAVPARGLKLDSFGNIPAGTINLIMSQLSVGHDATRWVTARSSKRAERKSRAIYFVPPANSGWKRGIFRRNSAKSIEPVLLFLKTVRYEARYAFFDISRRVAEARLHTNFDDAIAHAFATRRKK